MKKAILTGTFSIAEFDGQEERLDEIVTFHKGMEVQVLHEWQEPHSMQYVIFSEELKESTTVYEGLLRFLP